jgi:hypothetical protein
MIGLKANLPIINQKIRKISVDQKSKPKVGFIGLKSIESKIKESMLLHLKSKRTGTATNRSAPCS